MDSLARWAAGGRGDDDRRAAAPEGPRGHAPGTTRRGVLKSAAGAVGTAAFLGAGPLFQPPQAAAASTQLGECYSAKINSALADFRACLKGPLFEYESDLESLSMIEQYLREQKKPAARRRLEKQIKRLRRRRDIDLKDIEFCNAVFVQDRNEGDAYCESHAPPTPTGPGCEFGYLLCGDYCCDTNYAFCQGCSSGPTCCRNGGECCPGG